MTVRAWTIPLVLCACLDPQGDFESEGDGVGPAGGGGEGPSGLEGDLDLGDLQLGDWEALCAWSVDVLGGGGAVHDCGDGDTVEVGTVEECLGDASLYEGCRVTVREMEACVVALSEDPCGDPPGACLAVASCAMGGDSEG